MILTLISAHHDSKPFFNFEYGEDPMLTLCPPFAHPIIFNLHIVFSLPPFFRIFLPLLIIVLGNLLLSLY